MKMFGKVLGLFPFLMYVQEPKEACSEVFCKKVVLKNFSKFAGKTLCQNLSLSWSLQLYQERDSVAGVFLWILSKFQEHFLCRLLPGDCFCMYFSSLLPPAPCIHDVFNWSPSSLSRWMSVGTCSKKWVDENIETWE